MKTKLPPRDRVRRVALLLAVSVAAVALAACGGPNDGLRDVSPDEFASVPMDPPVWLPDWQLISHTGSPFQLSDLEGEVVVVYLGYTNCPDVCPMTLTNLAQAKRALPPEVREHFRVVMITVDPARDTPEVLARYMGFFDESFIGVSGDEETVLGALAEWGIDPVCSDPNEFGAYAVEHPSTAYLLNRYGQLRLLIPDGLDVNSLANDIELAWYERY